MAVNVPLVTISGLTEQTTAADTDCMVIGGTDAKKIKWSTIISLIKSKLGIGNTSLSGIGDGTITGAISSLNTNFTRVLAVDSLSGTGTIPNFTKYKEFFVTISAIGFAETHYFVRELLTTAVTFSASYYYNAASYGMATIAISPTGYYQIGAGIGGSNPPGSSVSVWAR